MDSWYYKLFVKMKQDFANNLRSYRVITVCWNDSMVLTHHMVLLKPCLFS